MLFFCVKMFICTNVWTTETKERKKTPQLQRDSELGPAHSQGEGHSRVSWHGLSLPLLNVSVVRQKTEESGCDDLIYFFFLCQEVKEKKKKIKKRQSTKVEIKMANITSNQRKVKTTTRHHFAPIGQAKIRKVDNT